MKKVLSLILISILLAGCTSPAGKSSQASVPNFSHIFVIFFENQDSTDTLGNASMPNLNRFIDENVNLTSYYAVAHPSLPNYLALTSGSTFNLAQDCTDCFFDVPNLADEIEKSGRSWKTYQEDMPSPCFVGDAPPLYRQKHNPFIYYDSIRTDKARCVPNVVPLTQLDADIAAGTLPNFAFITPNMCNSGHDCKMDVVDKWLGNMVPRLQTALDATGEPYLLVLTYDEGDKDFHWEDLFRAPGGHILAVLISPQAKSPQVDATYYTHYSLLKTISDAWGLPYLGHAADQDVVPITAPWK